MDIFMWIATACWVAWIVYWWTSAIGAKRDVDGRGSWARGAIIRVIILIILLYVAGNFGVQDRGFFRSTAISGNVGLQALGLALVLIGFWFSVWARIHLGRNWSSHPTHKADHELVTSGPYRYVRHPIYTGIFLAMIGSILIFGWIWIAVLVVMGVMFTWRIPTEERIMTDLFHDQYTQYKKRTKALIPFVW